MVDSIAAHYMSYNLSLKDSEFLDHLKKGNQKLFDCMMYQLDEWGEPFDPAFGLAIMYGAISCYSPGPSDTTFTKLQEAASKEDASHEVSDKMVSATQLDKEVALSCAAAFGQIEAVKLLLNGASNAAKSYALFFAKYFNAPDDVVEALNAECVWCPEMQ